MAPEVGRLDVYKVHHHCSSHSTNKVWLDLTAPTVAILSAGNGNGYSHPASDCLDRLRKQPSLKKVYWTEAGNGGKPKAGMDVIGGNIVVEVGAGASSFTVSSSAGIADSYPLMAPPTPAPISTPVLGAQFAWSSKSRIYHHANCAYVANISAANLEKGDAPPPTKTLHKGCPIGGP